MRIYLKSPLRLESGYHSPSKSRFETDVKNFGNQDRSLRSHWGLGPCDNGKGTGDISRLAPSVTSVGSSRLMFSASLFAVPRFRGKCQAFSILGEPIVVPWQLLQVLSSSMDSPCLCFSAKSNCCWWRAASALISAACMIGLGTALLTSTCGTENTQFHRDNIDKDDYYR